MPDYIFPSKLVSERFTFVFSFLDLIEFGDSLASANFYISRHSGLDSVAQEMLYKDSIILDEVRVAQQIFNGVPGVIYKVTCSVVTVGGKALDKWAHLAVLPDHARLPLLYAEYYTSRIYPINSTETLDVYLSTPIDGNLKDLLQRMGDGFRIYPPQVLTGVLVGGQKIFNWIPEGMTVPPTIVLGGDIYGGSKTYAAKPDWLTLSTMPLSGIIEGGRVAYDQPADWLSLTNEVLGGTLGT